jgi:hypothetical protein
MSFQKHFKALCRKNYINWYREWHISLLEILLPIGCMIAVASLRSFSESQT